MDPQFWHERWELNEIGFHQPQFNSLLTEYWPSLSSEDKPGQVFVPLCGKSLDMVWLRKVGHSVIGVELSAVAITDFFQEQSLPFSIETADGLLRYEGDGLELICGDFFDLEPRHLEKVQAVYDRAALIALPRELQDRYAAHLDRLVPARAPILLLTLEYDRSEMQGPPFSTPEERVVELFGAGRRIEKLLARDVLQDNPALIGRGLTRLTESAYMLRPMP